MDFSSICGAMRPLTGASPVAVAVAGTVVSVSCLLLYLARDGGEEKVQVRIGKRGIEVEETGGWVANIGSNWNQLLMDVGLRRAPKLRPKYTLEELEKRYKKNDSPQVESLAEDEILITVPKRSGPDAWSSDVEKRNVALAEAVQKSFPDRFEDYKRSWKCESCFIEIQKSDLHFCCGECYDFHVCLECAQDGRLENSRAAEIHSERVGECHGLDFFFEQSNSRYLMKIGLVDCASIPDLVEKAFEQYSTRKMIGERADAYYFAGEGRGLRKRLGTRLGAWHWYSYGEAYGVLQSLAGALCEDVGVPFLEQNRVFGIFSENRLEWALVDFFCLLHNLTSAAVPSTVNSSALAQIVARTDIAILFVSGRLLEKVLESLESINQSETSSKLVRVVCFDDDAVRSATPPPESTGVSVLSFPQLVERGSKLGTRPGGPMLPDDPGRIVGITFTSGSTGVPKGVAFGHKDWSLRLRRIMPFKTLLLYGYLPVDHTAGRSDLYTAFSNGGRIAFGNPDWSAKRFFEDMQTLNPTAFGPVPLVTQAVREEYEREVFKRMGITDYSRLASYKEALNHLLEGDGSGPAPNDDLVTSLRPVKEEVDSQLRYILGRRLSSIKVSSAPVTEGMLRFLRNLLQIPVNEGYGSTEVGSISRNGVVTQTVKLKSRPDLGYLVTDDPPRGEILVRKTTAQGYYKNASATDSKWVNGWFRTGDIGEGVHKHMLRIVSRENDVCKLSNGEFISLSSLEQVYLEHGSYSKQMFLYADPSKHGTVAICVPNDAFRAMCRDVPPAELGAAMLADLRGVAERQQLRRFEVPLDVYVDMECEEWRALGLGQEDEGLLTNSNKLCRRNLHKKYGHIIRLLYVQSSVRRAMHAIAAERGSAVEDTEHLCLNQMADSLVTMEVMESLKSQKIGLSFEVLSSLRPAEAMQLSSATVTEEDGDVAATRAVDLSGEYEVAERYATEVRGGQVRSVADDLEQRELPVGNIFLTGATGFLGFELLKLLLERYADSRIVCLVRKNSLHERLRREGRDPTRVVEVVGDLVREKLGLSETDYETAVACDAIVHCAAIVNHVLTYQDLFRTNVGSVLEIFRMCTVGAPKSLHYVSSTSALAGARNAQRGYGASKWAAEHLFLKFSADAGVPTSVVRFPLISSSRQTGAYNARDWLHRVLRSAWNFRLMPDPEDAKVGDYGMAMVPVDFCAGVVVDQIDHRHDKVTTTLTVRPKNVSMRDYLGMVVAAAHDAGHELKLVPYDAWYAFMDEHTRDRCEYAGLRVLLPRLVNGLGGEEGTTAPLPPSEPKFHLVQPRDVAALIGVFAAES